MKIMYVNPTGDLYGASRRSFSWLVAQLAELVTL